MANKTQKLTQRQLEQVVCPADQKLLVLRDAHIPGLGVKVYPSGKKTFFIRSHSDGRSSDHKLGDARILDLHQARQLAQQHLQSQLLNQQTPAPAPLLSPKLDDFFQQRYLPFAKAHQKSWDTTETLYRCHIKPRLGDLRLHEITLEHCQQLQHEHRQTHAPASTDRLMLLLKALYNRALDWKTPGVVENPARAIVLYHVDNKKERYLTPEEMQRLMQALSESAARDYLLPIMQMLALTGARKSEVLKARWQDMDLNHRRWRLPENKSGKVQYKVLSDAVWTLLHQLHAQRDQPQPGCKKKPTADWIFPSPITGEPFKGLYASWNTARKKAGLSDVRIHDLRHNFASALVNQGRSLYEVQALLGHADPQTTQRYAHLSQERLLEAVSCIQLGAPAVNDEHLNAAAPHSLIIQQPQTGATALQQQALALLRQAGWSEEALQQLNPQQLNRQQLNRQQRLQSPPKPITAA